ncbi:unnamed protein product [Arabis nemorensis]|uniref:Uncharacterized protein n=1 Tax=Arabis nemorensis TaxID=586526 RepID=A0A565BLG3_9BRAS|nr:unnamed protein product [Arabis nemorensis]
MVKNTVVPKPVKASISSVAHPSVEEDSMIMHRPVWDDWEFAEEEPIPRVVFSKPPSLQEAKEATEDLKEAINMVYIKSPMEDSNEGGSVSKMLFQTSENRAVELAVPQVALQAFAFLSENTAAQVKGDERKAEEYCERAMLSDNGRDGEMLSIDGDLIWKNHGDGVRAQSYFDQAVQSSPHDCHVLASYARFLWDTEEEEEEEEEIKYENGFNPSVSVVLTLCADLKSV